jgi:hypothetical protein
MRINNTVILPVQVRDRRNQEDTSSLRIRTRGGDIRKPSLPALDTVLALDLVSARRRI